MECRELAPEFDDPCTGAAKVTRMTAVVPPSSRKARCPCGSGRRYTNCHGAREHREIVRPPCATASSTQLRGGDPRAPEPRRDTNVEASDRPAEARHRQADLADAGEHPQGGCEVGSDIPPSQHFLRLVRRTREAYWRWIATVEREAIATRAPLRSAVAARPDAPRLSLVLPTFNSPSRWLAACLESVLAQTYPHWELCIADDASTAPRPREIIARYAARDPRIRVVWRAENGHISAASNSALGLATAPFVALVDHDDALPRHALAEVALALLERPDAAIVYSDEDKIDEAGQRFDPYFKPGWNPTLATGQNFVCHLGVYRTDLVREVGGFRAGFEGAQDWDLMLRCAERVEAAQIVHVPEVLYHWRSILGSTARGTGSKDYASAAQERTVREHARRCGKVEVDVARVMNGAWLQADPVVRDLPAISVVLLRPPSMEAEEAIARWRQRPETAAVEMLTAVVESEEGGEVGEGTLRLAGGCAAAINTAAARARGELLVFVDAMANPVESGWLSRLAGHALQPNAGCAGGVTVDAKRRTVRGGYILDPDAIAVNAFAFESHEPDVMFGRDQVVQNLSALWLTGLAVRRALWEAVGGLDVAHLAGSFHDVDLCLRLGERGLRHVWHPGVVFVDERRPREADSRPERTDDAAYMRRRHGALLACDPAYHPRLSRPPHLFRLPEAGTAATIPGCR
jgi:GT2 family glycosyltransferase